VPWQWAGLNRAPTAMVSLIPIGDRRLTIIIFLLTPNIGDCIMSFHSVHMQHPIKGGYRKSELIPITVARLKTMTWEELRAQGVWKNGNTKWDEMECVAFFFKHGFITMNASRDIGYSQLSMGTALSLRLDKVNLQGALTFCGMLMRAGLLERDFAWLLDPKRYGSNDREGRVGGNRTYNKHRIRFSKALCEAAVEKHGSIEEVSKKMYVKAEFIRFWLDK